MGSDIEPGSRALHILMDTNIVLDIMLKREPWLSEAMPLIEAQQQSHIIGYIPASALTDIFYISRRIVGLNRAFDIPDHPLADFELLPVDRDIIERARKLPGSDVEDNVHIACAEAAHLDLIVTRDTNGFRVSPIPVIQPSDIVRHLL